LIAWRNCGSESSNHGRLGVAYVVFAILSIVDWSQGTRAGISVSFNVDSGAATVTEVSVRSFAAEFGVEEGSLLELIDGMPTTEEVWSSTGDTSQTMRFVSPTGEVIEAEIAKARAIDLGGVVALEFSGVIFALSSLFVISRAWRSIEANRFAYFAVITSIAFASLPGSESGHLFSRAVFTTTLPWIPVAFIGLFDVLGKDKNRREQMVPSIGLILPLVGAIGLTTVNLVRFTAAPALADIAASASLLFLATGLFWGLFLLARRYFNSTSAIFREQIRVIAVGTMIAVLPVVLLNIVPNGLNIDPLVPPEFLLTASVIIPLSFGYAILRHDLLGIRRLVHRGVAYVLISAIVVALYAVVLGATRAWINQGVGDDTAVNIAILMALLGIPLIPRVRELSFSVVDRLLYKDFIGHREVVRGVSLRAVEAPSVEELFDGVLGQIRDPLGASFVAYIEREGITGSVGAVEDPIIEAAYRRAVQANGTESGTHVVINAALEGQVAFVMFPDSGDRSATICVGPKETGEPFSDEDLQMIQTIGGLLSTAVARLRLLEQLQVKNEELTGLNRRIVQVEEQERARISGYLHDEPLQKVSYALAQYRERNLGADLEAILDDAVGDLRNITATLSPAILMDLGLARSVEWLVAETDQRSDFSTDLRIEGDERESQLSKSTQLVAYRVVQESLTNCQKHAKPSMVWVSLEYENEGLLISVDDNGVGAPEGPDGLTSKADSLGLLSMRQRVESQNGFLAVQNRESRGFSVRARLPFGDEIPGPTQKSNGSAP